MLTVIQAEFFLAQGNTPEAVIEDCASRQRSHSAIKLVLRFRDVQGTLTELIKYIQKLDQKQQRIVDSIVKASGLRKKFLYWYLKIFLKHVLKNKSSALRIAKMHAAYSLQSDLVAIELPNLFFRSVRNDEIHETLESIDKATGVWLFVLELHELLSDRGRAIAFTM